MKNSWKFILARLFSGHFISMFGTTVFNASLIWWVSEKTGSTISAAQILFSASFPLVFLNLVSGALVDRWNKKYVLVGADILATLGCIGLYYISKNDFNIYLVMFFNFFITLSYAFFSPCARAIVPMFAPKDKMIKVNSFLSIGMEVSRVVAGAASGIVMIKWGASAAFLLNAFSFLISALFESSIPYNHKLIPQNKSIWLDMKDGLNYLTTSKEIFTLLLLVSIFNFFALGSFVALPLYLKTVFNFDSVFYGMCLSFQSTGALASAFYLLFFGKGDTSISQLAKLLAVNGIVLTFISFGHKPLILVLFLIYGLCLSQFNIRFFSFLQKEVNPIHLGKILSVVFLFAGTLVPMGQLFFGWYGESYLPSIYLMAGIGIIVSTLMIIFTRKELK